MRHGQTIQVQLTDERGVALYVSKVFVEIHFYLKEAYRYGFRFGPTNDKGQLTIGYPDVAQRFKANQSAFPMDFGTALEELDDRITIRIPTQDDLTSSFERLTKFYKDFASKETQDWPGANNGTIIGEPIEVTLAGENTVVGVPCKDATKR